MRAFFILLHCNSRFIFLIANLTHCVISIVFVSHSPHEIATNFFIFFLSPNADINGGKYQTFHDNIFARHSSGKQFPHIIAMASKCIMKSFARQEPEK